jgi:prepilin-type N-terminal cleavage/methylation domain-containing protein
MMSRISDKQRAVGGGQRAEDQGRLPTAHRPLPAGFTLIEMLATVAVLVIVLGVMVDLARHVRSRSAGELTRRTLAELDEALSRYELKNRDQPPAVTTLLEDGQEWPQHEALMVRARTNSEEFVKTFRATGELSERQLSGLPITIYDSSILNDAWGTPIVLVKMGRSEIGMAPGNRAFFFSAGPDRKYRTREDNLYSYEVLR